MHIAVLKELAEGETRVAATPETVKKFIGLGAELAIESGAGEQASIADADYSPAGASAGSRADALEGANIILAVQGPHPQGLSGFAAGARQGLGAGTRRPGRWAVGAPRYLKEKTTYNDEQ